MSVGPMSGITAALAGTPLAQTRGSDVERASQQSVQAERRAASELKAENAAGVGVTDREHEASERDADGRRLWEETSKKKAAESADAPGSAERKSLDATHQAGNQLDLSG
jgi:hypothetical protein